MDFQTNVLNAAESAMMLSSHVSGKVWSKFEWQTKYWRRPDHNVQKCMGLLNNLGKGTRESPVPATKWKWSSVVTDIGISGTNGPSPDSDYWTDWFQNIHKISFVSTSQDHTFSVGLQDYIKISDKHLMMTELSFLPPDKEEVALTLSFPHTWLPDSRFLLSLLPASDSCLVRWRISTSASCVIFRLQT